MQGKTVELEQMLRQKELEIERLQHQLESKRCSGSSDSSVDVCATIDLDQDSSEAYEHEVRSSRIRNQVQLAVTHYQMWVALHPDMHNVAWKHQV